MNQTLSCVFLVILLYGAFRDLVSFEIPNYISVVIVFLFFPAVFWEHWSLVEIISNISAGGLVFLVGFMRILSAEFCREWRDKLLNVHPSLLPKYAGGMDTNVHKEVLKNGETETGCTIHFVTNEVDGGPILIQKKCNIDSHDTVDTLKTKVQQLEGEAFIEAIKKFERI